MKDVNVYGLDLIYDLISRTQTELQMSDYVIGVRVHNNIILIVDSKMLSWQQTHYIIIIL